MIRKFLYINDIRREVIVDGEEKLVNVLRKQLHLTGTKMACGNGQCGACNVILNGKVVRSCLQKMKNIEDDSRIITIEGIGTPANMSLIQKAFIKNGCTQCGFCIPGFIVSGTKLLEVNNDPSREEIREFFFKHNNLCRCTGYKPFIDAMRDVADVLNGRVSASSLEYKDPEDGRLWGTRRPRPLAVGKATGVTKYGADMAYELPGDTLRLALVQSTVYHANILSISTSEAEKMPGVHCVITHKDIKGKNRIYGLFAYPGNKADGFERPVLCDDKVVMFGEAIAVVCADTTEHARAAAEKVVVEYEELPAMMSAQAAVAEDAIEIRPGTPNRYFEQKLVKGGNAAEEMAASDYTVESDFYTQRQPHLLIEPDVGFSYIDDDGLLTIQSKSIAVYMHRAMIAAALGIGTDKLRIIQNVMGGSFGYKLSPTMEALCGAVTLATGRPAYLEYTGYQNIIYTGKRCPNTMTAKIGADKDGKLKSLEFDFLMAHGPYSESGDLLVIKTLRNMAAGYHIPNIFGHGSTTYTNHAFCSPMRAYGAPSAQFMSECLIDMLAEKMGMDPWDLRYKNVVREDGTFPTGDHPDVVALPGLLEKIKPKYEKLKADCKARNVPGKAYGVGLSIGMYNSGSDSADISNVSVELLKDGSVMLRNTWEDHGQGGDMGSLQTIHEALRPLNIKPEQIHIISNDTARCPDSGPAAASRSQVMTGNATIDACNKMMEAMRKPDGTYRTYDEMVSDGLPTLYPGSWTNAPYCEPINMETLQFKPVVVYMYAVFLSEVEVDLATGKARVCSMTAAVDIGNVGNFLIVEGQIYGGLAQGIGFALTEDFEDYKKHSTLLGAGIPTIRDVPDDLEVIFQQTPRPLGPFGAAGVGELPLTSPHASIINAIYNACGARITHLPARPEKILAALEKSAL